jgi:hypothetical protein
MRFGWSAKDSSVRIRGVAKVAAILWIIIYITIYMNPPFSELWNSMVSNLLLEIPAALTATVATMVWAHYDKNDIPRRIWRYFAIGLWLWVIAEVVWGYLNVSQGEVSEGIADVFWVAAYIFFAHALFIQYKILAQPSRQEVWSRMVLLLLGTVALYALVYHWLAAGADEQDQFGTVVNSFYPVGDLLLAGVAIWLISHFRGGAFARPWLGLLAFSFTDILYAWIESSGIYSWSVDSANLWTVLFDTAYVGAYLILGLGILSQWAFLKYGLRSPALEQLK